MISNVNLLACIAAQQSFDDYLFVTVIQLRWAVPWVEVLIVQVLCHHVHSVNLTAIHIILLVLPAVAASSGPVHLMGTDTARGSLSLCLMRIIGCSVKPPSEHSAGSALLVQEVTSVLPLRATIKPF